MGKNGQLLKLKEKVWKALAEWILKYSSWHSKLETNHSLWLFFFFFSLCFFYMPFNFFYTAIYISWLCPFTSFFHHINLFLPICFFPFYLKKKSYYLVISFYIFSCSSHIKSLPISFCSEVDFLQPGDLSCTPPTLYS